MQWNFFTTLVGAGRGGKPTVLSCKIITSLVNKGNHLA